jgi:hypothetical protein
MTTLTFFYLMHSAIHRVHEEGLLLAPLAPALLPPVDAVSRIRDLPPEQLHCIFDLSGDLKFVWQVTLEGSSGGKRPCHLCWEFKDEFATEHSPPCGFCQQFIEPYPRSCCHRDIRKGEKTSDNCHGTRPALPAFVYPRLTEATVVSDSSVPATLIGNIEIDWWNPSSCYQDGDADQPLVNKIEPLTTFLRCVRLSVYFYISYVI